MCKNLIDYLLLLTEIIHIISSSVSFYHDYIVIYKEMQRHLFGYLIKHNMSRQMKLALDGKIRENVDMEDTEGRVCHKAALSKTIN